MVNWVYLVSGVIETEFQFVTGEMSPGELCAGKSEQGALRWCGVAGVPSV